MRFAFCPSVLPQFSGLRAPLMQRLVRSLESAPARVVAQHRDQLLVVGLEEAL